MGGLTAGYAGPKEVQYMFIDGEQLRRTADEVGMSWFGESIEIDYRALQGACQKVFYYDCLPAKQQGADEAAYKAKVDAKTAFFNELRGLPGWHVSQGLAKHRKKARQEQKEVDILIAVDMLTHTHRRNMHRLTFVSGDQDFAPLLEAVVRDGMYVELLYPEGHTAQDLMHFADVAKPMHVDFLFGISTASFRRTRGLPTRMGDVNESVANADVIGEVIRDGQLFAKVWRERAPSGFITIKLVEPDRGSNNYMSVRDIDEARAKRYFTDWMARDFGLSVDALEWTPCP